MLNTSMAGVGVSGVSTSCIMSQSNLRTHPVDKRPGRMESQAAAGNGSCDWSSWKLPQSILHVPLMNGNEQTMRKYQPSIRKLEMCSTHVCISLQACAGRTGSSPGACEVGECELFCARTLQLLDVTRTRKEC